MGLRLDVSSSHRRGASSLPRTSLMLLPEANSRVKVGVKGQGQGQGSGSRSGSVVRGKGRGQGQGQGQWLVGRVRIRARRTRGLPPQQRPAQRARLCGKQAWNGRPAGQSISTEWPRLAEAGGRGWRRPCARSGAGSKLEGELAEASGRLLVTWARAESALPSPTVPTSVAYAART